MFRKEIKAVERLSERLGALEDTCADLERGSRKLDLEFTELYDKVSHQMGRMAKRYAAASKENGGEPPEMPEPSHSDSLDPISRSIMLRRGGYRGTQ